MCRTKFPSIEPAMLSKGRRKYTADEKKVIAKNKAKRRRAEEAKCTSMIEGMIRGQPSPFDDLSEKMILSVTLRLANVWKLSYFILYQEKETSNPKSLPDQIRVKKSLLHDISKDHIVIVIHRTCGSTEEKPYIILYVTPSIQYHIHVNNNHELFGAKFEDYCLLVQDEMYVYLRTPPTQKEKRSYPNVRCRVVRSHYSQRQENYEMGFFLLQVSIGGRANNSKSGNISDVKHTESATKLRHDSFSKYSPQFWRAMQARRLAVKRGSPKSLSIPEQFKFSRNNQIITPVDERRQWTTDTTTYFQFTSGELHGYDDPTNVRIAYDLAESALDSQPATDCSVNVSSHDNGNPTELSSILMRKSLASVDAHLLSTAVPSSDNDRSHGMFSPFNLLRANNSSDNVNSLSPNQSVFQSYCSAVPTPNGSVFAVDSPSGVGMCNTKLQVFTDDENSGDNTDRNNLDCDQNSTTAPLTPILAPDTSDAIFSQVTKTEIDTTIQAMSNDNSHLSEESLNVNFHGITPTIGLQDSAGEVADQLNKLSFNTMENLRAMAEEGDPDSKCPCGLFTCQQCISFLDEIKAGEQQQLQLQARAHGKQLQEPAVDSQHIKKEVLEDMSNEGDETTACELIEIQPVTFTADCRKEDLTQIYNFLVYPESSSCNSDTATRCCHFTFLKENDSIGSLRRTMPSRNLMEIGRQISTETMDIGSSNCISYESALESRYGCCVCRNNLPSKVSFSGEPFDAPRYIGDSNTLAQTSLYDNSMGASNQRPGCSKMILSPSDVEMQGTPPNSVCQNMSDLMVVKSCNHVQV